MQPRRIWKLEIGPIEWLLNRSGPTFFPLLSNPGWSIVSPIPFAECDSQPWAPRRIVGLKGGKVYISGNGLFLSGPSSSKESKEDFEEILEIGRLLIARLRRSTRQFLLPRSFRAVQASSETLPEKSELKPLPPSSVLFCLPDYIFPTAITEDHLHSLANPENPDRVETHLDVILDALLAHNNQDYRTSILYSAIAMETAAGERLDLEYSRAISAPIPDTGLRIFDLPSTGGKSTRTDPIYDQLSKPNKNFRALLHERPLYLLRRSLMLDQPGLYNQAISLYDTRNKIAHTGGSVREPQYLPLTVEGSMKALSTAVSVLRWFGYPFPFDISNRMITVTPDGDIGLSPA